MTTGITSAWRCLECGRENQPGARRCWLCLEPRPGNTDIQEQPGQPRVATTWEPNDSPASAPLSPLQQSLPKATAICILITCCLLILAGGLGLGLLVVLSPAMIRLFRVARERRADPSRAAVAPGASGFLTVILALGITFLLIVSAVITFVAVCFPVGAYGIGLYLQQTPPQIAVLIWVAGCVGGLTLAGFLGYGLTRLFFRRTVKPPAPED
jgi:hypothetical protein